VEELLDSEHCVKTCWRSGGTAGLRAMHEDVLEKWRNCWTQSIA